MPSREMVVRWTVRLSRVALALVFVFAGTVKLADPNAFAQEIMRYQIAPWPAAAILAVWLPYLEIVAGAGLLVPRLRTGAQVMLTALLVAFTVVLFSAWTRGLNVDCGCFGPAAGHANVVQALERDAVLLGLLAWVWAHEARPRLTNFKRGLKPPAANYRHDD